MLSILFLILKIIGITFLILILIILFLLAVILFVPIRYNIHASKRTDKIIANTKVNWLFRFLSFTGGFETMIYYKFKILWFILFDSDADNRHKHKKKGKNKKKNTKKSSKKDKVESINKIESDRTEDSNYSESLPEADESEETTAPIKAIDSVNTMYSAKTTDSKEAVDSEEAVDHINKKAKAQKNKNFKKSKKKKLPLSKRIRQFIQLLKWKIQDKIEEITELLKKGENLKELIEDEDTHYVVKKILKVTFHSLSRYQPKKYHIEIRYGNEDPGETGKVMGYISMIYPLFGENLSYYPDFENNIFEFDIYFRGKVRLIHVLVAIVILYSDKKIRIFIRNRKKEAPDGGK